MRTGRENVANRPERPCATCHGDATATRHCLAVSMNHLSVDPMSFVVSCIPRCGRVCLALLTLTATVLGAATSAQGPVPTTAQIAELERAVAQYEAAAKIGKPDQQREMQYLLSMVRLATLYMQVDRIQEVVASAGESTRKVRAALRSRSPQYCQSARGECVELRLAGALCGSRETAQARDRHQ